MDFTEIAQVVKDYGFPVVMSVGMGYFIYFIWSFISNQIEPEIEKMHMALIRVIDQTRMLDQDMIRLQQKVNVVLEYRKRDELIEEAKEEELLKEYKQREHTHE
jgi:hypothetical protein